MATWRKIHTAPRNGLRILLGWKDCGFVTIGWWGNESNTWFFTDLKGERTIFETTPTHWLYLPKPPRENQ